MLTTSLSLLERLQAPNNSEAWTRFVELYTPLLFYWTHRQGVAREDAEDIVQNVLLILFDQLPRFQYDPGRGTFRGWLRTILRRQCANRTPPLATFDSNVDPSTKDPLDAHVREEYLQYLVARGAQIIERDFDPKVWRAFWLTTVENRSATDVGDELNMTPGAIYTASFRVRERLREELRGLMD